MPVVYLILFPLLVQAAPSKLDLSVNHPRTNLSLRWDGKTLQAQDRLLELTLTLAPCNQKLVFDFLESENESWKDIPATKPYPVQVTRNQKSYAVASGSALGKSLLNLTDTFRVLHAMAVKVCAIPKKT